ncbi:hypothetical protein AVEN_233516-1, partial [Araneus ventricosus]
MEAPADCDERKATMACKNVAAPNKKTFKGTTSAGKVMVLYTTYLTNRK